MAKQGHSHKTHVSLGDMLLCNLTQDFQLEFIFLTISDIKQSQLMVSHGSDSLKSLPANAGDTRDRVRSLGREDLLQEGTAAHSSILAYETP